jgi:hypothetical protein
MSAGAAAVPEFSDAEMELLEVSPYSMDDALIYDNVVDGLPYIIESITKDSDGIKHMLMEVSVIGKDEPNIQLNLLALKSRDYVNSVWGDLKIIEIEKGQELEYSFNGKHLFDPKDAGSARTDDAGYPVISVMRIFPTDKKVGGRRKNKSRRRNRKGKKSQSRRRR